MQRIGHNLVGVCSHWLKTKPKQTETKTETRWRGDSLPANNEKHVWQCTNKNVGRMWKVPQVECSNWSFEPNSWSLNHGERTLQESGKYDSTRILTISWIRIVSNFSDLYNSGEKPKNMFFIFQTISRFRSIRNPPAWFVGSRHCFKCALKRISLELPEQEIIEFSQNRKQ